MCENAVEVRRISDDCCCFFEEDVLRLTCGYSHK